MASVDLGVDGFNPFQPYASFGSTGSLQAPPGGSRPSSTPKTLTEDADDVESGSKLAKQNFMTERTTNRVLKGGFDGCLKCSHFLKICLISLLCFLACSVVGACRVGAGNLSPPPTNITPCELFCDYRSMSVNQLLNQEILSLGIEIGETLEDPQDDTDYQQVCRQYGCVFPEDAETESVVNGEDLFSDGEIEEESPMKIREVGGKTVGPYRPVPGGGQFWSCAECQRRVPIKFPECKCTQRRFNFGRPSGVREDAAGGKYRRGGFRGGRQDGNGGGRGRGDGKSSFRGRGRSGNDFGVRVHGNRGKPTTGARGIQRFGPNRGRDSRAGEQPPPGLVWKKEKKSKKGKKKAEAAVASSTACMPFQPPPPPIPPWMVPGYGYAYGAPGSAPAIPSFTPQPGPSASTTQQLGRLVQTITVKTDGVVTVDRYV